MIDPKKVHDYVQAHAKCLEMNDKLIDILEGNLVEHFYKALKDSNITQAFEPLWQRAVPINILPKIIDKLTTIYQTGVTRTVEDGNEGDEELMSWYVEKFELNSAMNSANELFNLCKTTLLYPYVDGNMPKLRVIQNNAFLPYSDDPVNPNKPTDFIVVHGKVEGKTIYAVYNEFQFYFVDSDGKVRMDLMANLNNVDGVNPYGALPMVYANESRYQLLPKPDSDFYKMALVVPTMLSDLNFAAMFQSFSIVYGIDVDMASMQISPNAFWQLKSDATTDKKPEIGTIKPTVDFDQVINLIETQLSMWLGTKGIKASSVSGLTKDNFASGVSKIIDEMDTYEARQRQVAHFQKIEAELWDLIINTIHPYWVAEGLIDTNLTFTPGCRVITTFPVQLATQSRGQAVLDLKAEFEAGFTSRKRAIQKLNPAMTAAEVEELIEEIDEERGINAQAEQQTEAEAPEPQQETVEASDEEEAA